MEDALLARGVVKPALLVFLFLAVVVLLGAAAQVTREEFTKLTERVEALELRSTILERGLFNYQFDPNGSVRLPTQSGITGPSKLDGQMRPFKLRYVRFENDRHGRLVARASIANRDDVIWEQAFFELEVFDYHAKRLTASGAIKDFVPKTVRTLVLRLDAADFRAVAAYRGELIRSRSKK